jgi:phytoene desaturase
VAVVGGGLAGLAAARLLGGHGIQVDVYEANGKPGGCCATTRISGYAFNDGALFLALPGMLDGLFQRLGLDRPSLLPLRRIATLQRTVLPDGTCVAFDTENLITVENRADAAQATARAREELRAFLQRWDPLLHLFGDDLLQRPLSLPRFVAKGWRHLPLLRGTVAASLQRSFGSDATRTAMAAALLYTGVPSGKSPAASMLALASMFRQGFFIPEGGMGRIAEVLSDAVRGQGGRVHLEAKVERILVRNGRACGVQVKARGVIEADAVISTASGMLTYGSLLAADDISARASRRAAQAALSHKGFVLQLGLANRIDARSYANYVIPFLRDERELFEPDPRRVRWPLYTVPTIAVPELAPAGASIVEMFPPIRQDLPPADWTEERKEELAAQAIDRLRQLHALDIAARRIMSPREFQDDMHLFAGALYGLSPAAGPAALFKHRSPIPGLYQAGQTTWPGFGVASSGLSGVMAAEALVRDGGTQDAATPPRSRGEATARTGSALMCR